MDMVLTETSSVHDKIITMAFDILTPSRQGNLGLFSSQRGIDHVDLAELFSLNTEGKNLAKKNSGKFYTREVVAIPLIQKALASVRFDAHKTIKIVDPFCGDGRLLSWMLSRLNNTKAEIELHFWDYDSTAVFCAENKLKKVAEESNLIVSLHPRRVDTFAEFFNGWEESFDLVITNPPWEVVKPDPKELSQIAEGVSRDSYVRSLKEFSGRLSRDFPLSRPAKAYGGWGVNLARVGTEVAIRLTRNSGVVAVVAPASILADQNSLSLREWIFSNSYLKEVDSYPAELKLFEGVDQPFVTFVLERNKKRGKLTINSHKKIGSPSSVVVPDLDALLKTTEGILPISIASTSEQINVLSSFNELTPLVDLEKSEGLWMGRELDETNHTSWLSLNGEHRFVKGRDISRFSLLSGTEVFVNEKVLGKSLPRSVNQHRIVWRDVSRPSQKRRVIAALLPPGHITGNSLGVLTLKSPNINKLHAILALVSSVVFEFQLRAYLATGHVSGGVMKKVKIPKWDEDLIHRLSRLAQRRLKGEQDSEVVMEIQVAKSYGLNKDQFTAILGAFPKFSLQERQELLKSELWAQ